MIRILGFFGVVLMLLTGTLANARRDEPEQWIAFISDRDGNAEIYRMRPDGRDVQQLTQTSDNINQCWLKWSPRGEWLYFARAGINMALGGPYNCNYSHSAPTHLAMRPDGSEFRNVALEYPNSISASGQWFATTLNDRFSGPPSILLVRANGSQSLILGEGQLPLFSPNGNWIVFLDADYNKLYVIRSDGSNSKRIVPDGLYLNGYPSYTWTPDSQSVVFGADEIEGNLPSLLYRVNVQSNELELISDKTGALEGEHAHLSWSPDGKWLIYQSLGYLYALPLNEDDPRRLVEYNSPEFTGVDFSWSPDSQWIVFSKMDEAGLSKIWRIHPDGTGLEQLTFGAGEDLRPAWSPVIDKAWNGWELIGIGAGLVTGVSFWRRWR